MSVNWLFGLVYNGIQLISDDTDCEDHVIISRRGSIIMSSMLDGRSHQLLLPVQEEADEIGRQDLAQFQKMSQDDSDSWTTIRRSSISLANYGSNVLMFDNTIVDNSPKKAIGDHILKALHKVRYYNF
jgi:hypothetical protein